MTANPDHFILICSTCDGGAAVSAEIAAEVSSLPDGFAIRHVSCMAGCERPCTVGFQATDKAQYLFGDIESDDDIAALLTFARQYHISADGWTKATDRPKALLHKTLARLPRIGEGVLQ